METSLSPSIRKRSWWFTCLKWCVILALLGVILVSTAVWGLYRYMKPQLPATEVLKDVRYQIPLSVYSRDGKLIAQFGEKKRTPIKIDDVPEQLIRAILAAEDDRFFDHPGVDYHGLLRAGFKLLLTREKREGGSTITMQVARNFFLTPEKTFMRKFKEIFIALKIEKKLSKREILELYLNKIYFGHRAYGVGAAAQVYYGKNVDELDLAQMAMIAGIPKAPSKYNPVTDPNRALDRRLYVLQRMRKLSYITDQEFHEASNQPLTAKLYATPVEVHAPHIAEMVREKIVDYLGENAYTTGYQVFTTVDSRLQRAAQEALMRALHEYDERHGYRGAERQVGAAPLEETLKSLPVIGDTQAAIVSEVADQSVTVHLENSETATLSWENLRWARPYHDENSQGPAPKTAGDILKVGDIIRIRRYFEDNTWRLAQVPQVEGALVSLNPSNGAINALVGGFDFAQSNFNRATQAKRQPGSGFKPILYTAALENGFSPASIINDAPIVLLDGSAEGEWRPKNYGDDFYGPTRLRVALSKSRNLVSVRLLRQLGIDKVVKTALRFGLPESQLPRSPSLALGSGAASPLEMARVFSTFANGGFLIEPHFIDHIESMDGEVLYRSFAPVACEDCSKMEGTGAEKAPRIISPQIQFLMYSLLQDVIRRGTAVRARELGREDIAGKTGTTNEQKDAWFNGFSPDLVATAWVGFDSSQPLGDRETGGKAALPMWMHYMKEALKDAPEHPVEQPDGVVTVRIDPTTGLLASPDDPNAIFEYFIAGQAPTRLAQPNRSISPGIGETPEQHIQSLF